MRVECSVMNLEVPSNFSDANGTDNLLDSSSNDLFRLTPVKPSSSALRVSGIRGSLSLPRYYHEILVINV